MTQAAEPDLVHGPRPPVLARIADGYTLAVVVALGAWTVAYRLALTVPLTRDQAIVAVAVALGAGGLAAWRLGALRDIPAPPHDDWVAAGGPWPVAAAGVVALAGALAWESDLQWALFSLGLVAVGLMGLARSVRAPAVAPPDPAGARPVAEWALVGVAVLIGLVLVVGVVRPDGDDVDLFSRSAYIEAESGELPTGDVIYDPPYNLRVRHQPSWEPFVGVVAALLPLQAGDVAYLLFPPLLALAGIGAIYLLVREFSPATAALGTLAAVVFLALDGGTHRAFGNFSFVRMWQGKAVLAFLVVPLCWRYGIVLLDRLHARAMIGWVAALAAAVGVARTGTLLAPAIVASVLGTAVVLRRPRAMVTVAGAVFPAVLLSEWLFFSSEVTVDASLEGLATVERGAALGSAPWVEIMSTDWVRFVAAAAICGVAFYGGRRAATAVMATATAGFGFMFAFPVTVELFDRVLTASGNAFRTLWFLPVPALVGILVAQVADRVRHRVGRVVAGAGALVVVAGLTLAGGGQPTWDADNGAEFRWFAWKVAEEAIEPAQELERLHPAGVVTAPLEVQQAVALLDPDLHPVIARRLISESPEFQLPLRYQMLLANLEGIVDDSHAVDVALALDELGVTHACVPPALQGAQLDDLLAAAGFSIRGTDQWCDYWLRDGLEAAG